MQLFDDEFKREMRQLIREETQTIRDDIGILGEDAGIIKSMLGNQDMRLKSLQSDAGSLKIAMRTQNQETLRINVLLEDLNDRFAAARELRWD